MLLKFWIVFLPCLLLFACIANSQEFKSNSTKCFVTLNNSIYQISISTKLEFVREDSGNVKEWIFDNKKQFQQNQHSRLKRSTSADDNPSGSYIEISRLKRKISRLEKKLSESMNELSNEITHGFRRIEDKIRDMDDSSPSKRAVRHQQIHYPCPKYFYQIDIDKLQSCYLLSNFNTTWYEAKSYCTALDSHLVAMGSIREHYIVTYLIKNNPEHSKAEGWWTSGTFVSQTKQWMWTSDTYKPFTFIRWAPSQPDGETANCVYLRRDDDQLWNDELCTYKFNFVCEKCYRCEEHNGY